MASMASAQTTVTWWHAMGGELGELLEQITVRLQREPGRITASSPLSAAPYTETMTGAIAAFRWPANSRTSLQVFEVGTRTMMAAEGAIYPIYQLMEENDVEFDPSAYLGHRGRLLFRSGRQHAVLPVQFLDPDHVLQQGHLRGKPVSTPRPRPRRWAEAEEAARAIVESGAAPCGFTTSWPSWVMAGELLGLAQHSAGHDGQRLWRLRDRTRLQQRACGASLGRPEVLAGRGSVPLGRPPHGGDGPDAFPAFYAGELRLRLRFFGQPRWRACQFRSSMSGFGFQPYYDDIEGVPRRTPSSAAPRCGFLTGHTDEGIRGRRRLLRVPFRSLRVQADWHQAYRLPADHPGRVRAQPGAGLLRREPGCRHLDPPDDAERADREFARSPAFRATSCRSATSSRKRWNR